GRDWRNKLGQVRGGLNRPARIPRKRSANGNAGKSERKQRSQGTRTSFQPCEADRGFGEASKGNSSDSGSLPCNIIYYNLWIWIIILERTPKLSASGRCQPVHF